MTGPLPRGGTPCSAHPGAAPAGDAVCRTIVDGPNEDPDKLATILFGAVSVARNRIMIMTPYFLPFQELISALEIASMRGIRVDIILPSRNNLPPVHWATQNMLRELVLRGVGIYYQPPPFVHSKLFVMDDHFALIGSANIDPRSLRLNFELGIEVYDAGLVRTLAGHMERCRSESRRVSLEDLDALPLVVRTRNALAWIFSPYL